MLENKNYKLRQNYNYILTLLKCNLPKMRGKHSLYDLNKILLDAIQEGNFTNIEWAIEMGAKGYNWALSVAASSGRLNVVQLMLELGADDYNDAMLWAAIRGHIEIVELMLEMGATNYEQALLNTTDSAIGALLIKYIERKGKKKL